MGEDQLRHSKQLGSRIIPSANMFREAKASELLWFRVTILGLIGFMAFSTRLFSVIRFESIIHEFDPWFNYRTTIQLVENGFYDFLNWFDELSWYPLGRVVGGTVYPGIIVTAGIMHYIANLFHFPIHIREVCVFLAPIFSAATAWAAYGLTSELHSESAGLLAALFLGIAPGYISRSVAGSYDNEGIAIFLLVYTFYWWIKAVKNGSVFSATMAALFYFYMVSSWGGYVFIINLIPLHALVLMLMGRFTSRLYIAYSTFYAIGTLASMQIPFVGFQPTFTSEHMAALGVFGLMQIFAFCDVVRKYVTPGQFKAMLYGVVLSIISVFALIVPPLIMTGKIAPWAGRFYSLWDANYAKIHIPIISSVSEHQPAAWGVFFFDTQLLITLLPAGVFLCFKKLRDESVFVIIYAIFASYFAGVMIRLVLTLTPICSFAAAIAISSLLDTFFKNAPEPTPTTPVVGREKAKAKISTVNYIGLLDSKLAAAVVIAMILAQFVTHCTYVTSNAYSSPSVVLASKNRDGSQNIIDDFREAYYWLRMNTDEKAKIMSWWDYGYQITGFSNRTVLVDNNTWNNTHIATVGKMMSCSEEVSYPVMRRHDVDYVLVIFGGPLGYSGDDINKFLWMIRIGEGIYPEDITERNFFTNRGEYKVDQEASETMKNSMMYKMSYYRFPELFVGRQAVDQVRNQVIPPTPIKLNVVDEAFTSANWIVRIYAVKKPDIFGRSLFFASNYGTKRRRKNRARGGVSEKVNRSGSAAKKPKKAGSKKK